MAGERGFKYVKEFRKFARRLSFGSGPHFDDVESECWVAYLSLERLWNEPRSYLLAAVWHKVIDAIKKQRYYNDYDGKFLHISFEEMMRHVPPGEWPAEFADWETSEEIDDDIEVGILLAQLKDEERALLHKRFYDGMLEKDIGAELGITRSAVGQRLRKTLRRAGQKLL